MRCLYCFILSVFTIGMAIEEEDLKCVAMVSGVLNVDENFLEIDFQERCKAILPNPEDEPENYVQSFLTLKYSIQPGSE